MKIVSRKSAKAIAEQFVPPPTDSFACLNPDFAWGSVGEDTGNSYLRPLNRKAHAWLLEHGTRGKWVQGRLRLPEWIHDRRRITFLAGCAGLITTRSDLAPPPERPKLRIVNRVLSAAPVARSR